MDTLLIAIVMLGLPSLVAHILTLVLLWDCRNHGHSFGQEAKYAQTELQEYLGELIKIGSDVADTLEVAFDSAAVTTIPQGDGSISLTDLDPKEMLLKTITTLISNKLNPEDNGSTQSEEWQVHKDSESESENDNISTQTQTEELESD